MKSIEITLQVEESASILDAVYVADRKKRMRIDIYLSGQRIYTEAFDGIKGWQQGPKSQAVDSTQEGSAALLHGIILPGKLFGLHEMTILGNQVILLKQEEIECVNYYTLELKLTDGYSAKYYINPNSWMIDLSRDLRALHPDVDPTKTMMESKFLDYKPIDGVMHPFRIEEYDLATGQIIQKGTVKTIKHNIHSSDSLFSKP